MGLISGLLSTQDSSDVPVMLTGTSVSSGNKANTNAVAAIPALAGQTAYVTGIQLTGCGATAANAVNATLAGLAGGTAAYAFGFPAGPTVAAFSVIVTFYPALAASAMNTAITLTLPSSGAGGTNAAACIQGFYI